MTYPICRQGDTQPGTTTVTLERDGLTFVVKDVPALVCANCGEEYLDSATSERVLLDVDLYESLVGEVAVIRDVRAAEAQLDAGMGIAHEVVEKRLRDQYLK
jgi:YgiT-type zinc finger domain-containing protein